MLFAEERKDDFHRAVVTEIARAQETDKTDPGRHGNRAGTALGPTKQSHREFISWLSAVKQTGTVYLC